MQSTLSGAHIKLQFQLLCKLGPSLGLLGGWLWIKVNNSWESQQSFPGTPTIEGIIGVTTNDIIFAFGDQWRKYLYGSSNPDSELSTGFKYAFKNKG